MADADIPTKVAWVRTALDQYEAPLVRYAARITGDVDRARDVVQETFLRLCTEPRAKVDGHLREWLFAVCRNQAVDVLRKEGRMRSLSDAAVETHASRAESPPAVAEGREAASDVVRVLSGLPDNQQEVIRLRFQNGLSYREISAVTELTVSNVGYLIHMAIKAIREKLSDREAEK